MSGVVEDFIRMKSFHYFVTTGNLIPRDKCPTFVTDEEYLVGGCMGLCQDLARYGMGRAIMRDDESIREARDLVDDLLQHLLDYDFQNDYLWRKFEDTKYALKTLETIMYEVNITADDDMQPLKKRAKLASTLPIDDLQAVFDRIEHRENLRKQLSGICRKIRKYTRQAIYRLHRDDFGKAFQHLTESEKLLKEEVLPIIKEENPLKSGTYVSTMEDYIEAKIFYAWLAGKEETLKDTSSALLTPADFELKVRPEQYLSGLCNVTAQIVQVAMQKRTENDMYGLQNCLEAISAINNAVLTLERCPVKIGQRFDQLRKQVAKLERMLYAMSLSKAAGGKKMLTEAPFITPDSLVPKLQIVPGTVANTGVSLVAAPPEAVTIKRLAQTQIVQNIGAVVRPAAADAGAEGGSTSSSSNSDQKEGTANVDLQIKNAAGDVVQTMPVSLSITAGKKGSTSGTAVPLAMVKKKSSKKSSKR